MTSIEWTHRPGTKGETWNTLRGCSLESSGCAHCYAMRMAHRFASKPDSPFFGLTKQTNTGPKWTGYVQEVEDALEQPFKWREPRTIFVNSMSDTFHPSVSWAFIEKIFAVMALCPQHTFIIVTKRADRMLEFYQRCEFGLVDNDEPDMFLHRVYGKNGEMLPHLKKAGWFMDVYTTEFGKDSDFIYEGALPLPNVWLLVSVEDQKTADERIPKLVKCPAAVRGVSYEPALGPVVFGWNQNNVKVDPVHGCNIHWCISGGESGPSARPAHPDWFRDMRDQCKAMGIKYFHKQWGRYAPSETAIELLRPDQALGVFDHVHVYKKDGHVEEHPDYRDIDRGDCEWMFDLGKHRSGNFLDGVQHLEFPA